MSDDFEQRELSPAEEIREKAIQGFPAFANNFTESSNRRFMAVVEALPILRAVEEDSLFLIVADEGMEWVERDYFSYYADQEGNLNYHKTAEATVFKEDDNVILKKVGRKGESEELSLKYLENEPTKQIDQEDDEDEEDEIDAIIYSLSNIKGEETTHKRMSELHIYYNPSGLLNYIHPFIDLGERGSLLPNTDDLDKVSNPSVSLSVLERSNDQEYTFSYGGAPVTVAFDKRTNIFTLTIRDRSGDPRFNLAVPRSVDVEKISEATDYNKLIKNKLQPSDGIPEKSAGDTKWRLADFSEITGIKLTPIDNDIPGPR